MSEQVERFTAYELVNIETRSIEFIPAPGIEVVLAIAYDAVVKQNAALRKALEE